MEEVSGVQVFDRLGSRVELSSFWTQRATVLVFVRHFG